MRSDESGIGLVRGKQKADIYTTGTEEVLNQPIPAHLLIGNQATRDRIRSGAINYNKQHAKNGKL